MHASFFCGSQKIVELERRLAEAEGPSRSDSTGTSHLSGSDSMAVHVPHAAGLLASGASAPVPSLSAKAPSSTSTEVRKQLIPHRCRPAPSCFVEGHVFVYLCGSRCSILIFIFTFHFHESSGRSRHFLGARRGHYS